MELPNPGDKWIWGMSLALYSRPYRETNGTQVNTSQGEMVNKYKYHDELTDSQRMQIARNFAGQVFDLVRSQLEKKHPNPNKPPFDVVIGLPENRNTGRSLPRDLCRLLANDHPWMRDGFSAVTKTRRGTVLKGIKHQDRPGKVAGLYSINRNELPNPRHGFLIIDDVFETGSTISGLCDILEKEFPSVPRFVVALTHLHATERISK